MKLHLAPAKPRDATALACILADWIDETPWMPDIHTPNEDRDFLTYLIRETEVIMPRTLLGPQGFMARDGAEIHALYLVPGVRGQGIGKRLLDQAKSKSPELTLWTFQANLPARRFYAREGFREVRQTNGAGNDEKLPDVRLAWQRDTA